MQMTKIQKYKLQNHYLQQYQSTIYRNTDKNKLHKYKLQKHKFKKSEIEITGVQKYKRKIMAEFSKSPISKHSHNFKVTHNSNTPIISKSPKIHI